MAISKKSKAELILVLAVLSVSLILNIYFFNERNELIKTETGLRNQVTSLQNDLTSLTTTYDFYVFHHSHENSEYVTLEKEYNNYKISYTITNSEYDALQATYDSYISTHSYTDCEYDSLQSSFDNYVTTHTYTNSEYDFLQSTYDNYTSTHSYTDSQYDSLQLDYTQLQTDYSSLQSAYSALEGANNTISDEYWDLYFAYLDLQINYTKILDYIDRPLESKNVPSVSELETWLFLDSIDSLGYQNDFNCKDFSTLLSVKARTKHWDMGIVAVHGYDVDTDEYYGHAFNFIITDEGLVYVEPQTDSVWWYSDHREIKVTGGDWEIDSQWIRVKSVRIVVDAS